MSQRFCPIGIRRTAYTPQTCEILSPAYQLPILIMPPVPRADARLTHLPERSAFFTIDASRFFTASVSELQQHDKILAGDARLNSALLPQAAISLARQSQFRPAHAGFRSSRRRGFCFTQSSRLRVRAGTRLSTPRQAGLLLRWMRGLKPLRCDSPASGL